MTAARFRGFVLILLLGITACDEPPVEEDNGGPPPLCDQCHKLTDLQAERSTVAPLEHMRKAGNGLVRIMELTASTKLQLSFSFSKRGHHSAFTLAQCAQCHPVSAEGVRHGMSQYPPTSRAAAFKPETCAASCHAWLKKSGTSTGFTPKSGSAPTFSGSLRPGDLLAAAAGGHGRIYKQGFNKSASKTVKGIKVGRILSGCVGCHNTQTDKHGETPGCLQCHTFGGSSGAMHKAHVDAITKDRATIDPGNAGSTSCDYCHGFSTGGGTLKSAACYSCHLSGHQVNEPKTGKPHFWGG